MNNKIIKDAITDSIKIKILMDKDEQLQKDIGSVSDVISTAIKNGKKLLVCGNGGSAADAQHIAGEFVNKFFYDRPPMSCIALTTDTSVITAIGNDYDFDMIFAKQVEANGNSGDVLLGISTSGNSNNVVEAFRVAKNKNITTVALIGCDEKSKMAQCSDFVLSVKSNVTPRIQEAHMLIYHIICQLVEKSVFPR